MSNHDDSMDEPMEPEPLEPYAAGAARLDADAAADDADDLGAKLRSTLRDGDTNDVDAGDDPVPAIRRRAAQRRQRKVLGLAMAAVVALLIGGSAVALGRTGPTTIQDEVASENPSSSVASTGRGSIVGGGPDTNIDTASSDMATSTTTDAPSTTDGCADVITSGGSGSASGSCITPTTPTTVQVVGACPGSPSCTTLATVPQPSSVPPTTIPATNVTPTTPTTTNGQTIDCGSSTPSGYPTTTMANPNLSKCLVDAFNVGQHATLTVVRYNPSPTEREETEYEVIGLHVVKVVFSTNSGAPTTPPAISKTCTSLTNIWPDPALVQVSKCT